MGRCERSRVLFKYIHVCNFDWGALGYLYRLMVPIVQIRLARFQKYASAGGNM